MDVGFKHHSLIRKPVEIKSQIKKVSKVSRKIKVYGIATLLVLVLIVYAIYQVNKFFETHQFVFSSPITIQTHMPIRIALRLPTVIEKTLAAEIPEQHISPLNANQQYLCDKFGKDCSTALAIQRAENGTGQCDRLAFNYGKDGKVSSVDMGYMQINSIHLKKGWTGSELLDCKANIDHAYEIFKQQGFTPWVTFTSGAYKKFIW